MWRFVTLCVLFLCNAQGHAQRVYKTFPEMILDAVANGLSVKLYGNYCGPNYGDLSYKTAPLDMLDQACLDHDRCYDSRHHGLQQSCACDVKMIEDIIEAFDKDETLRAQAFIVGVTMDSWLRQSPCVCRRESGVLESLGNPKLVDKNKCVFEKDSPYGAAR
jgi:hypothetical protein